MKLSAAIISVVILGFITNSSTLPARKRMVYVHQQPQWPRVGPQRMMYVQYVQPSHIHARSTQAAAALVAGDSVATGSYLNDCDHSEADIAVAGSVGTSVLEQKAESQLGQNGVANLESSGGHSAQSVAEAYPEENEIHVQADEIPLENVPAEFVEAEANVAENESGFQDSSFGSFLPKETSKAPGEYFSAGTGINLDPNASDTENQTALATESEAEADISKPAEAQGTDDSSIADVTADFPPPAPINPIAPNLKSPAQPPKHYLPAQKKVYVELEHPAEDDAAEEAEENEEADAFQSVNDEVKEDDDNYAIPPTPINPVRVPNAHRPTKKIYSNKPKKANQNVPAAQTPRAPKPLPSGTFFPVDFGGATGGAIAIANSFSTGEGGSATSHAIAYGTPDMPRARVRSSRLH